MSDNRSWADHLKFALPLLVAAALTTVFVVLLVRTEGSAPTNDRPAATTTASTLDAVPAKLTTPQHSPGEEPTTTPKEAPDFGGRYPRWNIKEFPKGWDPELADTIHAYFQAMQFDAREPRYGVQQTRQELRDFLASLGPEALPTLGAILNAEGDFVDRRFLLAAIGNLGVHSEQATFILKDFFLNRHEVAGNRSEMIHAIDAMGTLHNETAYDTITDFIHKRELHSFRPKLIEVLAHHPNSPDAVGDVVSFLQTDPHPNVRNKAAQFLGRVPDSNALHEIYHAVKKERSWVVKQTLLGTIGKIGDPASLDFLADQAQNAEQSAVRLSAARAISRLGTPDAALVLADLERSEPDPKVNHS